jgi:hypothetical protein
VQRLLRAAGSPSLPAVLAVAALLLGVPGCDARSSPPPPPGPAPSASASAPAAASAFLKGQLHAHTSGSGDSDTPPAEAAAWYAAHGFDFVVFTDHDRVTELAPSSVPPGLLVLRGVELTQNLRTCTPPPAPGDACLLHLNALFVAPTPGPIRFGRPESLARGDLYGRALDRALALGGVAQLDHPNFQGGADLDVLLALAKRGLALVEIANEAVDSDNEGGLGRLSTEALWDAALSAGARVFGTATDDAHHYGDAAAVQAAGGVAYTGDRGFVMVRAPRTEAALRAAVVAGDFYASTGVLLERLDVGPGGLDVTAAAGGEEPYTFEVIAAGRVVERMQDPALHVDRSAAASGYARVRVTDARGRRAWTQPIWR